MDEKAEQIVATFEHVKQLHQQSGEKLKKLERWVALIEQGIDHNNVVKGICRIVDLRKAVRNVPRSSSDKPKWYWEAIRILRGNWGRRYEMNAMTTRVVMTDGSEIKLSPPIVGYIGQVAGRTASTKEQV